MTAVEGPGVAAQQAAHDGGERSGPGAEQQVEVVGDEAPGEQAGVGQRQDARQAIEEILTIGIVREDLAPLNAPGNDVMQGTGRVQTRSPWHTGMMYTCRVCQSRSIAYGMCIISEHSELRVCEIIVI